MQCNPMYKALCEIYEDSYGSCDSKNVCLVQLLGEEMMLDKCKWVGLDKLYPDEYERIVRK